MPRRSLFSIASAIAVAALATLPVACTSDDAPAGARPPPQLGAGARPPEEWARELDADDAAARIVAAEALRRYGEPARRYVPKLTRLLERDPDPGARRSAAAALGDLGPLDDEALEALREALTDEASGVRSWAATALATLGDDESLPLIRPLVEDPSWDVRRLARAAVLRLESRPAAAVPPPVSSDSASLEALGYGDGTR